MLNEILSAPRKRLIASGWENRRKSAYQAHFVPSLGPKVVTSGLSVGMGYCGP